MAHYTDRTPMEPTNPIVHPARLPVVPEATEYVFGVPGITSEVLCNEPEWIKKMVSVNQKERRATLGMKCKKWEPSLAKTGRRIASANPKSLVFCKSKTWLRLEFTEFNSLYLPTSADPKKLRVNLIASGVHSDSNLLVFLDQFGGLGENYFASGRFVDESVEFLKIPTDWLPSGSRWLDSVCFFFALNGDILLYLDDENVAWWREEEGDVVKTMTFTDSLIEFVDHTEYNSEKAFDSYPE